MIPTLLQITGKKGPISEALGQIYDIFIDSTQTRVVDDGYVTYELRADFFKDLAAISSLIGSMGALFYISYRVWKQLADGEPIAIFPLLRPFVIGLCITFFPTIIKFTNATFYQLIRVTEESTAEIENIKRSSKLAVGNWSPSDPDLPPEILSAAQSWAKSGGGFLHDSEQQVKWQNDYIKRQSKESYVQKKIENLKILNENLQSEGTNLVVIPSCDSDQYGNFQFGKKIECALKNMLKWIVEAIIFLVIFFLNIYRFLALTILYGIGPLAFGLSIFDGFQGSLTSWVTRYVNIYLWLPVGNIMQSILGVIAISVNALYGDNFWYMLLFGVMCIFMFMKIPQITSWIVQAPMEEGGGFMGSAIGGAVGGMVGGIKSIVGTSASKGGSLLKKGASSGAGKLPGGDKKQ